MASGQVRIVVGLAAALLLAGLPVSASAQEEPVGGCPVVASAEGIQVMFSNSDNIALEAPAGAGVPVAQACVDYGVRDSRAFAGSPYPGETVIAAPGVVGARIGQELPGYPAYAASRYPAKEQASAEQPGYTLQARSSETSSDATARTALSPERSGSTVSVAKAPIDPAAKTSSASSRSDTEPLTIAGVLHLGHVQSAASARLDADGKVTRSSELTIGRTTVGGQEVVITPEGVRAAGQTTPLPEAPPTDVLKEAGVSVRYLSVQNTSRGVLSAGVEVVVRREDPQSGAVSKTHYVLGRSFASAGPVDAGTGPAPVGIPPIPVPPAATGGTGAAAGSSGDIAPAPGDRAPAPAAAPGDEPPAVAGPLSRTGSPAPMGLTSLYLVLVFGALAMFASATLLRLLGVKNRWT